MITKYKIVELQRDLPNGTVTESHWIATKSDGDFIASCYGSIFLPEKDPSDPTFVSYDDITEEQAIEWTLASMGVEQVNSIEANLDAQILAQKEPKTASGTPWGMIK
jgi:hypothetical protein